ncbi:hypothetical protein Dimus_024280 [Dionaea muscipula]
MATKPTSSYLPHARTAKPPCSCAWQPQRAPDIPGQRRAAAMEGVPCELRAAKYGEGMVRRTVATEYGGRRAGELASAYPGMATKPTSSYLPHARTAKPPCSCAWQPQRAPDIPGQRRAAAMEGVPRELRAAKYGE